MGIFLQVQECIEKCDQLGPEICKIFDYEDAKQSCRAWTGECKEDAKSLYTVYKRIKGIDTNTKIFNGFWPKKSETCLPLLVMTGHHCGGD